MEPASKRPRLSFFPRTPDGTEMDTARYNNDMFLKSRFEAIFTKYSQDFSTIGDEVNIMTGEIVVDNGHLKGMITETDPGLEKQPSKYILDAMAYETDEDGYHPDQDHAFQSIEALAEDAIVDLTMDASEDSRSRSKTSPESCASFAAQNNDICVRDTFLEPYQSEDDSLFELDVKSRSTSVDSLFQGTQGEQRQEPSPDLSMPRSLSGQAQVSEHHDDGEIINKFGPDIGKEVLDIIEQRREAHIDPKWRIPVKFREYRPTAPTLSPGFLDEQSPDRGKNKSLWRAPRPPQRETYLREESEDPLQEDYSADNSEDPEYSPIPGAVDDEEEDPSYAEGTTHTRRRLIESTRGGICPYCDGNFFNKSGVMAHWDRWLKRPLKHRGPNDPHDLEAMTTIRAKVIRRKRLQRLVIYDFRTMVELHEGARMSFDEIAETKVLRTRKTGLQLQDIYDKHRTPAQAREQESTWEPEELDALMKLSQNSMSTIATVRRGLRNRDELEIGNKLADIWVAQIGSQRRQQAEAAPHIITTSSRPVNVDPTATRITIKSEDSDDELFG